MRRAWQTNFVTLNEEVSGLAGHDGAVRTLFTGGQVWDGGDSVADADVVVEDGVIVEVGPGLDGDESVDLAGATLLPGLIDCHVHVMFDGLDLLDLLRVRPTYRLMRATHALRRTLEAGVTTVREAGGADAGLRDAVRDGLIAGPRMLVAISMLSITGGHGDGMLPCGVRVAFSDLLHTPDVVVDSPDEARKAVRRLRRAGADVIKVATSGGVLSDGDSPRHPQFQPAELAALVAEARDVDMRVMAHAQATEGIRRAVEAGIDSIEHGIYLDEPTAAMMVERGTFLVPTLVAPRAVIEAAEAGAALSAEQVDKAREVSLQHEVAFRIALDAGVRIAMGTDCGVHPHGRNLEELVLMAKGGMPPAAVLRAATSEAASLLGLGDRLGRLEPGFTADLVAVRGDVFEFVDFADRVTAVVQGGQVVVDRRSAAG